MVNSRREARMTTIELCYCCNLPLCVCSCEWAYQLEAEELEDDWPCRYDPASDIENWEVWE